MTSGYKHGRCFGTPCCCQHPHLLAADGSEGPFVLTALPLGHAATLGTVRLIAAAVHASTNRLYVYTLAEWTWLRGEAHTRIRMVAGLSSKHFHNALDKSLTQANSG
jgi:hypothetical protein